MEYLEVRKQFDKYLKRYDFKDKRIEYKYFHSIRVGKLCVKLAKHLGLTQDDLRLAFVIGLLHDLGRFEQIKVYDTFDDFKSFDHGLEAVKMLAEDNLIRSFIKTNKNDEVIKKALYIHNKYKVNSQYQAREKLFSHILRDADKIDILAIAANKAKYAFDNENISSKVLEDILNKRAVRKENVKSPFDHLLLTLGLIYDIKFNYSFKLIKENNYLTKIAFKSVIKDTNSDKIFKSIINNLLNFVDDKLKEDLC